MDRREAERQRGLKGGGEPRPAAARLGEPLRRLALFALGLSLQTDQLCLMLPARALMRL